jgi:geranylgeranyl reductase family protein
MKYDVVVVGAGPAGATAAKVLAEKKVNVLLLDKETFPRDKPCGGGLPARVLKRYPYLEQQGLIDSYSTSISIHSSSLRYSIDVRKNETIIGMVLRDSFDAGLVRLAQQNGATFLGGKAVVRIDTGADHARVVLDDGTTVDASYIIGADGMWSTLAKQLGEPHTNLFSGMCVVEEYPVAQETMDQLFGKERCIHIHFNIFGIAGYGWVFPKKEHVNIGLVEFRHALPSLQEKKNLKELYARYLDKLKEQKLAPNTLQSQRLKGGVFPTRPLARPYGQRIIICGDAAGFVNAFTGEGIYYAMVSGEIAGKALIKALANGGASKAVVPDYQKMRMKDFGYDLRRFFRLSKRWNSDAESVIRIINNDQRLIDLVLTIVMQQVSIRTQRLKIGLRFIQLTIRHFLHR